MEKGRYLKRNMLRKAYKMTDRFVSVCNRLYKPNTGKEDGNRPAYCES
jgi:hypothetical protein